MLFDNTNEGEQIKNTRNNKSDPKIKAKMAQVVVTLRANKSYHRHPTFKLQRPLCVVTKQPHLAMTLYIYIFLRSKRPNENLCCTTIR